MPTMSNKTECNNTKFASSGLSEYRLETSFKSTMCKKFEVDFVGSILDEITQLIIAIFFFRQDFWVTMGHKNQLQHLIKTTRMDFTIAHLFFRYLLNYFRIATKNLMLNSKLSPLRAFSDHDLKCFFEMLDDVMAVEIHDRWDDVSQVWDENHHMTTAEINNASKMLHLGIFYTNNPVVMNNAIFEQLCKKPCTSLNKKTEILINSMAMKAVQTYVCISDQEILDLDHGNLMNSSLHSAFFTKILMKSYIGDFIHEFIMKNHGDIEENKDAFGTTDVSQITGFFEEYQELVFHKCREMGVEFQD
jgi:hypothetical protein